jgi:SpoVK/Ycf46/Vps4 family AAA+-type ATPase
MFAAVATVCGFNHSINVASVAMRFMEQFMPAIGGIHASHSAKIIGVDGLLMGCCRRGSDNNAPAERLVNQLLTEMDGIDGRVVSEA